jgi:membrane protein YdbS with pleckstrin-like domain
MVSMPMQTVNRRTQRARRLKLVVAAAACLYVLVNAFLILCLVHPSNGHSHGPTGEHFHFTCVWVQKAVSSHTLSARVFLPAVEAILFVLSSFPLLVPLIRAVQVNGRSPPSTALA